MAHNGNITNAGELRRELEHEGSIFQASSDTEVILHLVARSRERTLAGALREALLQLEGAFSLVFLAEDRVIVARDPHGFRPLALGKLEDVRRRSRYVFASETCAFDLINAVYLDDVEPGEMVFVGPEGMTRERYAPERPRAQCVFEHVYFSRPDSIVFGRSGAGIPREPGPAAGARIPGRRRYRGAGAGLRRAAAASATRRNRGMPFRQALIRNHYVGRTFIEPSQAIRDFGVKLKLNPVRHLLEGKRVVLVDDSIVRGTTSRKIVRMVRNAGAREVHLRISCPPTISPCFYGVDTPSKNELIAANNTVEEIRRFVEADSLGYLSLDSLRQAVDDDEADTATPATPATIRPSWCRSKSWWAAEGPPVERFWRAGYTQVDGKRHRDRQHDSALPRHSRRASLDCRDGRLSSQDRSVAQHGRNSVENRAEIRHTFRWRRFMWPSPITTPTKLKSTWTWNLSCGRQRLWKNSTGTDHRRGPIQGLHRRRRDGQRSCRGAPTVALEATTALEAGLGEEV